MSWSNDKAIIRSGCYKLKQKKKKIGNGCLIYLSISKIKAMLTMVFFNVDNVTGKDLVVDNLSRETMDHFLH